VFRTSTLPSFTNAVGDTYPDTESRSIFRTMTFLCVEGIKEQGSGVRNQGADTSGSNIL
jgi:hypothetical protein